MLTRGPIIYTRDPVSVAPTLTIIIPETFVGGYDWWELEIVNQDATQVLTCQLEQSAVAGGPYDVYDDATFSNMDPNATPTRAQLRRIFEQLGNRYVRLRGSASGAGLTAERTLRFYREHPWRGTL